MLSKELTTEFQNICREEFGMDLAIEKAENVGGALLKYVQLLTKMSEEVNPDQENKNEKQQDTRNN